MKKMLFQRSDNNNMDQLHKEIEKGNLKRIKYLINKNQITQDSRWLDFILLQKALQFEQKDIAKFFIAKGFRLNRDLIHNFEETPLHHAVNMGCLKTVEILLNHGASVDINNLNKETPLTLAAKQEKYAIVDLILPKTSQENCKNKAGLSHMHIACMRNEVDVVKKFLQNGEDINEVVSAKSNQWAGYTALHFAAKFQCMKTVEYLVNCGADITIQNEEKQSPLHIAYKHQNKQIIDSILFAHTYNPKNPKDSQGMTHFHIACTRNNSKIVNKFLDYLDIDSYDYLSSNPDFSALQFAVEYECKDVVKLLLDKGADISRSYESISYEEIYANILNHAYIKKNREIINLIEAKLNHKNYNEKADNKYLAKLHEGLLTNDKKDIPNLLKEIENIQPKDLNWAPSWPCCTALHLAVHYKNQKVCQYLIKKGADIVATDTRGKTPLHLAFDSNQMHLVDLILKSHYLVKENPVDSHGLSHFHISCTRNSLKSIKTFLENGADVNKCVEFDSPFYPGFTPLHLAIKSGNSKVVEILIQKGADITVKNGINLTPFEQALKYFNKHHRGYRSFEFTILELLLLAFKRRKIESFIDGDLNLLHIASATDNIKVLKRFINSYNLNKPVGLKNHIWSGYTPLHFAMVNESKEAIAFLLERGADISAKNAQGNTPLNLKYIYNNIKYMDDSNGLIMSKENSMGTNGISHFHIACREKNIRAVKYFLKLGVDVNEPISYELTNKHIAGKTPLHLATYCNCELLVDLLLDGGAEVQTRDVFWRTPLHNGKTAAIVDMLVDAGADVNAEDINLSTPLSEALYYHYDTDVIDALLRHGADLNAKRISLRYVNKKYATVLLSHICKINILGFHLSKDVKKSYYELQKLENGSIFDEIEFDSECRTEIEDMSTIHIDSYTTLKDILFKNVNQMSRHAQNITLKNLLDTDDFDLRFPNYGYLLKLQLKRGFSRESLIQPSELSLRYLAGCEISSLCLDMIFEYLTDKDLQNLILSTENIRLIKKCK